MDWKDELLLKAKVQQDKAQFKSESDKELFIRYRNDYEDNRRDKKSLLRWTLACVLIYFALGVGFGFMILDEIYNGRDNKIISEVFGEELCMSRFGESFAYAKVENNVAVILCETRAISIRRGK